MMKSNGEIVDERASNIQLVNGTRAKVVAGLGFSAILMLFIGAMVTITVNEVTQSRKELTEVLTLTAAIGATQVANTKAIERIEAWRGEIVAELSTGVCSQRTCEALERAIDRYDRRGAER